MGIELAQAYVRVRGDSSAIQSDLEGVKRQVETQLQDIGSASLALFRKLQGIPNFLRMGVAAAIDYEQTQVAFETMIGSAEETKKTLQRISDFAAKTPFEMPQLLSVSKELINFGDRGDDLMDTLKMLGDASGGTADKFSALGFVFNKVRATTRLQRDELMQLANPGILTINDLAKFLGKDTKVIDDMLTKGKISFEMFAAAIRSTTQEGGRNFKAMERQSETLGGLQSTLNDSYRITARIFAESLVPVLKVYTKMMIYVWDVTAGVAKSLQSMGTGALVGAAAFTSLGTSIATGALAMKFFGISFRELAKGLGWATVFIAIGTVIGSIVGWVSELVVKTSEWTKTVSILGEAWGVLKETWAILLGGLGDLFYEIFGIRIPSLVDGAATSFAGLLTYLAEWVLWGAKLFKDFVTDVAFIFRNFRDLMGITWANIGIGLIDVANKIRETFWNIVSYGTAIWKGLGAYFATVIDNMVIKAVWLKNEVMAEWEAIKAGFEAAFDPTVGVVEAMDAAYAQAKANTAEADTPKDAMEAYRDAVKAAREEQAKLTKGSELFGEQKDWLEQRKKDLTENIKRREDERERLKKKAEEAAADANKDEENEKEKKLEGGAAPVIEAGRYGFADFGTKFQDAILKGKGDQNQQKMIGLLDHGNKIQERQLEELKKNSGQGSLK